MKKYLLIFPFVIQVGAGFNFGDFITAAAAQGIQLQSINSAPINGEITEAPVQGAGVIVGNLFDEPKDSYVKFAGTRSEYVMSPHVVLNGDLNDAVTKLTAIATAN